MTGLSEDGRRTVEWLQHVFSDVAEFTELSGRTARTLEAVAMGLGMALTAVPSESAAEPLSSPPGTPHTRQAPHGPQNGAEDGGHIHGVDPDCASCRYHTSDGSTYPDYCGRCMGPCELPQGRTWRVGEHYGIHVYEGDRPVATFHDAKDAASAVASFNAAGVGATPPAEAVSLCPLQTDTAQEPQNGAEGEWASVGEMLEPVEDAPLPQPGRRSSLRRSSRRLWEDDDAVERACRAMWDGWDGPAVPAGWREKARGGMRAALRAAEEGAE